MRAAGVCLCTLLGALGFAVPGQAQSPDAPTPGAVDDASSEQAREAFTLGNALAGQGQWADALAAFERSASLRSHPVTTYNLGYCERALGHFTRARKLLAQALADHHAAHDGTLPPDLEHEANGYLREVDRRLAHAQLEISPLDAAVSVDGRPLEAAGGTPPVFYAGTRDPGAAERAPGASLDVLVDPGRHRFVASRAGAPDAAIEVDFTPGSTREVQLTVQAPAGRAARRPGPDYTWAILSYGVGAAGLVTGSVFGLATFDRAKGLDDVCGDDKQQCPASASGDMDAADRYAMISNIGFGVGIAGVALGTVLVLTAGGSDAPPAADKRKAATHVRPWIGAGSAGVAGTF